MKIMEVTTIADGAGDTGGRVIAGIEEDDMADGFTCSKHPYKTNTNPGGICAFCLQEKLGKLVSSSLPLPIHHCSSSSSSPSFSSSIAGVSTAAGASVSSASLSLAVPKASTKSSHGNDCHYHEYNKRRAIIPFLLDNKKKKKVTASSNSNSILSSSDRASNIVLKRSKSIATPRRSNFFFNGRDEVCSSKKRGGFWSFLHFSKRSEKGSKNSEMATMATPPPPVVSISSSLDVVESSNNNGEASIVGSSERKVSRSRSVGCGSRSFHGDLFERISTGFGDCTLRRVESQREGKSKAAASSAMKERVRCGGIFSGLIMASSSSSSSSSSYWLSSSSDKITSKIPAPAGGKMVHGRNRSWGWAFASPMRAFGKSSYSSKDGKRDLSNNTSTTAKTTPNLSAIPSLLSQK